MLATGACFALKQQKALVFAEWMNETWSSGWCFGETLSPDFQRLNSMNYETWEGKSRLTRSHKPANVVGKHSSRVINSTPIGKFHLALRLCLEFHAHCTCNEPWSKSPEKAIHCPAALRTAHSGKDFFLLLVHVAPYKLHTQWVASFKPRREEKNLQTHFDDERERLSRDGNWKLMSKVLRPRLS